jgi:ABC-2 type transport system permease protein
MRKYLAIFKTHLLRHLEQRTNNFIWFIVGLIPAIVNYVSWKAIYGNRESLNGFQREDLLGYFVVMTLLWYIVGGTINSRLAHDIRDGFLSNLLVKPIHPIIRYMFVEQSWKVGSIVLIIPTTLILFAVFQITVPIHSFLQCMILIITLVFAAIIYSLWDLTIGMFGFFFTNITPINRLNRVLYVLLSGRMIPLALYPQWMGKLNNIFFYRYTFGLPADVIFTFDQVDIVKMIGMQLFWIGIILGIFNIVYKFGIKKYESYGA